MKTILILIASLFAIILAPIFPAAAMLAVVPPMIGSFSPSDLAKWSKQHLSSFDGFEGDQYYTGRNDDMLDFSGNKSFASVTDAQRTFVMTVTNAHSAALKTYLLPGMGYYTGQSVDGIPKDGTYYDTLHTGTHFTGSGSPQTIALFFSFIQRNPTQLLGMRIEGSATTQMSQQIEVTELSPFRTLGSTVWNLNTNQTEDTYRDKIVTFSTPGIILGDQLQMSLTVPAGVTTSITFYCGAVLNTQDALKKKFNRAQNTFEQVPIQTIKSQEASLAVTRSTPVLPIPDKISRG